MYYIYYFIVMATIKWQISKARKIPVSINLYFINNKKVMKKNCVKIHDQQEDEEVTATKVVGNKRE